MRVFFNEDWIHFLWTRMGKDVTEKTLKDFIYQYKGTTISDFAFNINGTVSSSPSKILETWIDKYLATEENGVPVDYTNTFAATAYDLYVRKNLDMYAIWIAACREIGIRPWLSIRINDAHGNVLDTCLHKSSKLEKMGAFISSHKDPRGYFAKNLDFSNKAVYDMMLSYIKEQAEQYDADGIELDFSREAYCFPAGKEEEGKEFMLSFVKEVRAFLEALGEKRGKKIELSLVGQANPISALKTGYDFAEMARQGLMDYYVAAPRFETVNTDMPIEIWKTLLGPNVQFGCSHGLLLAVPGEGRKIIDAPTDMGQAAANAARGADFIHLYNHFDLKEGDMSDISVPNDVREYDNLRYVWENIGKIEESERWTRRIPVTFDDFPALSEARAIRLPSSMSLEHFRIPCGKVEKKRQIYLHIVMKADIPGEELEVFVNTNKAAFCPDVKDEAIWAKGNQYTFAVDLEPDKKILGIEIQTQKDECMQICYLDAVIPAAE